MTDDIVARLRESDGGYFMRRMFAEAADEIERLRKELGQVSDADSWVSKADAAILDSLLNWCEFNEMDSHRALQRLVNDRARLRAEVIRLRAERDALVEQRDRWIAGTQLHAASANENPPEIRRHWDSADA